MVVPAADSHVVSKAVNEVQEKVAQLKNRVAEFLLVIAKVAKNMENPFTKTSIDMMDELKELKEYVGKNPPDPGLFCSCPCSKRCLASITYRLQAINDQNLILTTLLSGANKKKIDECVTAFQDSIARFQVNFCQHHAHW